MLAASYSWRNGDYYDYGWFVPIFAIILMVRRWREDPSPIRGLEWRVIVGVIVAFTPALTALRILGQVDPTWRLPVGLMGLLAAVFSHWIIGESRGWRSSRHYGWITLFLCSAIPWPSALESGLVRFLTGGVIHVVAEVFFWLDKPVQLLGDRLQHGSITVEVTDGCSGLRSFQTFFTATWFFAEIHRLKVFQAGILMVASLGLGFLVNTARTFTLAWIRIEQGEESFDAAHDGVGILAFVLSAAAFYLLSGAISRRALFRRRRHHRVDKTQKRPESKP